ncbi:MAG: histidine ammonia-lyase, partial [Candidatus Binatota bacterium]|nr:histidine ammonia-lyase [Candidatus Binatota bacterium]
MVCFDSGWRTIEEIVAIAEKAAAASLSPAPEFRAAIARGADFLDRRLAEDGVIYG